jgi:hypothetical protein
MKTTFAGLAIVILLVLSSGCAQTASAPVTPQESSGAAGSPATDVPIYRVGDTWTLRYQSGNSYVQTVVAVTEKQTTFSSSRNGRPPNEVDFDNQGNLTRVGNETWEPSEGSLRFPMMVRESWHSHLRA